MQSIPSYKEILRIALPLMLGGLSESISAIVDTAFMGHLGTFEMDAMGMANVFMLLIIMIGWSFSRSVQILVAQYYGAKSFQTIGRILSSSLKLILPISIGLTFLLVFCSYWLLNPLIHQVNIHEMSTEILQVRAFGLPFLMASLIISSYQTGIGQTRVMVLSQGVAAVSNIVMNYFLVFGIGNVHPMGYVGSALATVLSEVLGLGVLLIYVARDRDSISRYGLSLSNPLDNDLIRKMLKLASPMMLLHLLSIGSWVYFFSMLEHMGPQDLAISLVLKQIFTAITLPGFSLANTSNTLVGQLVGARRLEWVLPTIRRVVGINYAILICLAVLTFIFRSPIVHLFSQDPYVADHFTYPLIALLSAYLFIPASNVFFGSLSALGNTRIPLYVEFAALVCYVIYIYVLIEIIQCNLTWAWTSETLYWLVLLMCAAFYFYRTRWQDRVVYLDENKIEE